MPVSVPVPPVPALVSPEPLPVVEPLPALPEPPYAPDPVEPLPALPEPPYAPDPVEPLPVLPEPPYAPEPVDPEPVVLPEPVVWSCVVPVLPEPVVPVLLLPPEDWAKANGAAPSIPTRTIFLMNPFIVVSPEGGPGVEEAMGLPRFRRGLGVGGGLTTEPGTNVGSTARAAGERPDGPPRIAGSGAAASAVVRVFHSDHHVVPLPPGHRFPMGKYRLLREALLSSGVLQTEELVPAEAVEVAALLRVHTPRWVEAVLGDHLTESELRRLGFPWSPELVLRSLASVGGTCAAAARALAEGIGGNLAGGTHHAFPDHGEGYCVFNDIAVSIRSLQAERSIRRALVVDLDVHQGNGTAAVFAQDPEVFTFSMHGEHNFPFRKQRSSLDIGLPDGAGDDVYLDVLARHLPRVLEASGLTSFTTRPESNPLAEDALGRLALTHAGLEARDTFVLEAARRSGLPVVVTLGGGYARPLDATVRAHIGTYRAVRTVWG